MDEVVTHSEMQRRDCNTHEIVWIKA